MTVWDGMMRFGKLREPWWAPFFFDELIQALRKRQRTGVSAPHREENMFDAGRRPMGRLFYWLVRW